MAMKRPVLGGQLAGDHGSLPTAGNDTIFSGMCNPRVYPIHSSTVRSNAPMTTFKKNEDMLDGWIIVLGIKTGQGFVTLQT